MKPADFKGFTPAGLEQLRRILAAVIAANGGRR